MSEYFAGLDLGQASDFSALVILERVPIYGEITVSLTRPLLYKELHVRYVERLALGTPYPAVVRYVVDRLVSPALKGRVSLALDFTGVGRPVADMFATSALACPCTLVIITGGDKMTLDGNTVRVPKRDLVGCVQVALQNHRLLIAPTLSHAALLVVELQNFRVKIDPQTAHDAYSSWREADHDDLVLSVALACWSAQESQPVRFIRIEGVSRK